MVKFEMYEGIIPLHVSNNRIIVWKNGKLETLENFELLRNKLFQGLKGIIRRIFRSGPNFLVKINSRYIYHGDREFQLLNSDMKLIKGISIKLRGSKPLNLNRFQDGVIFGEYYNNPERQDVKIFFINKKGQIRVLYTFKKKTIRHIHNCIYDLYTQNWFILTGDTDEESGIYTLDSNLNVKKLFHGSQKFRAVSIIFLKDYIVLPTDTPLEDNFIQVIDRKTGNVRVLRKIIGSAFHTYQDEDIMLISTVTEPSTVNKTIEAVIYASLDGFKWIELLRFKKDFFPVNLQKITRYSEIRFLDRSFKGKIICEGRALKGLSHGTLVLNKEDIINKLISTSG